MAIVTTADGTQLHLDATAESDRPALLLVHALGADDTMWDPQMPAFSAAFRVIRYDQRGHGRSSLGAAPETTIEQLGQDALAILDALGVRQARYCGMSIGGAVGLWLANNARDRFPAMILASTAGRTGTTGMWEQRIADVRAAGTASQADATMGRWFTPAFRENHADIEVRSRGVLLATPADGYIAACAALRDADFSSVGRLAVPALLLAGALDPSVAAAEVEALAGHLGAEVGIVPEVAHLFNVERPDLFNAAALEFFARH